jgi:hypothetical protein
MFTIKRQESLDPTKDFIDGGALVYAYSNPVIAVKISEIPRSRYAGICKATWTLLGTEPSKHVLARGVS